MKKIIFVVFLLVSSNSFAWEFNRNPDRFPSVGFNVSNYSLSGTRNDVSQVNATLTQRLAGPLTHNINSIGLDLRLPVSDQLTFTLSADNVSSDSKFTRDFGYTESYSLTGYHYSLGARLYFSK